jgi:ribosomal-protein-alanine N-acetyltransferase
MYRQHLKWSFRSMITLRKFVASDIDLLVSFLNNPEVTQYITGAIPQPYTKNDAHWWIENSAKSDYIKAIECKGAFVGCISATIGDFEYNRSAELGYWVARDLWNTGIATAAVKEFSNILFETTHIVRLFVSVVSSNGASIRVLEKNGYKLDGILNHASCKDGQYFNEHLLSKICL